ncbi:MAG TPA: DUF2520 domain-containing protein [Salinivirgaceae bacterium]|nr:DUF2520 domain-containing protein [Salinivirgaceae bacterium]
MNKHTILPIYVVGTGGVARSLVAALRNSNYPINGILTRNPDKVKYPEWADLQYFDILHTIQTDSLFFLTIPDREIVKTAQLLKYTPESILIHCAGSVSLESLSSIHPLSGVFYPLQTFHPTKIVSFQHINVCIESTHESILEMLQSLADDIGAKAQRLDSQKRLILHTAAVFACNFTNLMFSLAESLCDENNIDFSLLHPLIAETSQKAIAQGPSKSQTGPAMRNDLETINKHITLLPDDLKTIYRLLSDQIRQRFASR